MEAARRYAPRAALGLAVSGALLYFAFRHTDFSGVGDALRAASPGMLALSVLANLGLHALTAVKWRWIARRVFDARLRHLFGAVAVGEMSSNVLPIRMDEPLRAWWLHRKAGVPATRVFGTIVVDRIVELFAIVLLLFWVLQGLPDAPDWVREGMWVLGAVLLGAAAAIALILRRESGPGTTRLGRLFFSLKEGLAAIPGWGERAVALGLALLQFVFHALCYHWALRALGADLPPRATALAVLASHISFAIPSGPSAIGAFEWVQTQVLMSQGLDRTMASAAAILVHAVLAIPITAIGAAFLGREPLRGLRLPRPE